MSQNGVLHFPGTSDPLRNVVPAFIPLAIYLPTSHGGGGGAIGQCGKVTGISEIRNDNLALASPKWFDAFLSGAGYFYCVRGAGYPSRRGSRNVLRGEGKMPMILKLLDFGEF